MKVPLQSSYDDADQNNASTTATSSNDLIASEPASAGHETPKCDLNPAINDKTECAIRHEAPVRPSIAVLSDGLPATGFVRPFQVYRPIGPVPISASQFWVLVRTLEIPSVKISPHVTVFAVSAIRERLLGSEKRK
jgi:hypothetical protein